MGETLEKCIPPKSILLQIRHGWVPSRTKVTGQIYLSYLPARSGQVNIVHPGRCMQIECRP